MGGAQVIRPKGACPEGATGLSPGFQPWEPNTPKRIALKGRQIESTSRSFRANHSFWAVPGLKPCICIASCPNPSRCCPSYPIIPYPTGRFFRGTLSQALRARLRSVSSLRDALADISQQHLAKACCELSRRDGAIVAWHEVPGKKRRPKEPSRRVRCDRVRRTTTR